MKTILLVEDDIDLREALRDLIAGSGYRVETCPEGRAALAYLEHSVPDLLLIDGTMPVLDGFSVLSEIKRRPGLSSLPIILMSAESPKGSQDEYGWTAFLRKPLDLDHLNREIARLLRSEESKS